MTTPARAALQASRRARGWSQTEAARELAALARTTGGPVATPASLKSLLSRWENGHASPDPAYRALLGELYGRTAAELDLSPAGAGGDTAGPACGGAAARLRARLAAAQALDGRLLDVWAEQLAVARRLDEEVGTAGAAGLARTLVEELEHLFAHAVDPVVRAAVGLILARAANLAGWQELDRGDPERAWGRFVAARAAAAVGLGRDGSGGASPPGSPQTSRTDAEEAMAEATAGLSTVLVDIRDFGSALMLIGHAPPPRSGGARAWLEAARGAAEAARGRAAEARRGFDAAEGALSEGALPEGALPEGALPEGALPEAGPATGRDVRRCDTSGARHPLTYGSRLAEVRCQRGQALAALGEPGAVSALEAALATGIRSVRVRAATHAALAVALSAAHPAAAVARLGTAARAGAPGRVGPSGAEVDPGAESAAHVQAGSPPAGTADAAGSAAEHARAARTLAERIGSARTVALLAAARPASPG